MEVMSSLPICVLPLAAVGRAGSGVIREVELAIFPTYGRAGSIYHLHSILELTLMSKAYVN